MAVKNKKKTTARKRSATKRRRSRKQKKFAALAAAVLMAGLTYLADDDAKGRELCESCKHQKQEHCYGAQDGKPGGFRHCHGNTPKKFHKDLDSGMLHDYALCACEAFVASGKFEPKKNLFQELRDAAFCDGSEMFR